MTNRNQGGFGGFNFDPDQLFGPQGILNQVFGNQGGAGAWGGGPGAWGGGPGRRQGPPFGPGGGPFGPGGPGGPGGRGSRGPGRRARRGDVRNAILHLLQGGEMNGYQLMQQIANDSGGAWQPSSGAIYPALAQLEDEGLVHQVEIEGRKAYQLTDAGTAAAADLPPQTWAGGEEPEHPWAEDAGRGHRGRDRGRGRHQGWAGAWDERETEGRARRQRGAQLWKALGSVAMATQAVGQAGDDTLSREAADLLDQTRRELYRLLAEAEVARDDSSDEGDSGDFADQGDGRDDGNITEAEIVED